MEEVKGIENKKRCPNYQPTFNPAKWPKHDCLYRADDEGNAAFCKRADSYRCIIEAGVAPIPQSQSSVGNFLICPYLYYLKDIRGVTVRAPFLSNALKMGKLWDLCKQKLLGVTVDLNATIEEYEIGDMEIAKVRALYRAYKTLGVTVEPGYDLQAEFLFPLKIEGACIDFGEMSIKGFYDRKYEKYFAEDKLSSRPDNYLDPFFIQSQIGTYFLVDSALEYCIMEVVRTPDLRSVGKFKDESPEEHEERTYQDIISRPSFYFNGWDKSKKMYGKKFYRGEFDLEEIAHRYKSVSIIMNDMGNFDGWYKNDKACSAILPGIPCDMKPICRSGGNASDEMYTTKEKKGAKG